MKLRGFIQPVLLLGVVLFSTGCAAMLLGTGIVGGIIISDDSVDLPVEKSPQVVFDSAIDYLSSHGLVNDVDEGQMHIYAEKVFGKYYVQVDVKDNAGKAFLTVQARKTAKLIPDTDTASKIAFEIVKKAGI